MDKLYELTNTNSSGTNFYDISKASMEIGLSANSYKLKSIDELKKRKTPIISQVIINNYKHFVVVYKIKKQNITIMDPAKGIRDLSYAEFGKLWTSYILELKPYKKLPFLENNNYLNSVIKDYIKQNKLVILGLFVLTIITTILTGLYSYYFKVIIDEYQRSNSFNMLITTIIFAMIIIIKIYLDYLRNKSLITISHKLDLCLITTTIKKIIHLPYSYYKNKTTGETIARINDLFYLKNILTKIIATIVLDFIFAMSILFLLFLINKRMTIVLLVIIIIYVFIFMIYKPKQEKLTDAIQESNAVSNSHLVETCLNYETIKGLSLEDITFKKVRKVYQAYINNNYALTKVLNEKTILNDLITGIIITYLAYFGLKENMTIGTLLTYYTLVFYFLTPVRNIIDFYQELYYGKNSLKRINNLLNYKYERLDSVSNTKLNGNIKINNLNFAYQQDKPVLNNINLNIKKGDKVLLLGNTGSGKSTLLKLIYRYYDCQKGMIYLDNIDTLDYDLNAIRNSITYISQKELLYVDTIKNNIALGRNIKEKDFKTITKLTYVDDIVKEKILSYDMPLDELGHNLSGGEAQRIVLARALLKEANIILIDEGLNQIDINLENKILKNVFKYYKNKTIIIVSHRKSNYKLYNKVYKITNGYIKSLNNNDKKEDLWN